MNGGEHDVNASQNEPELNEGTPVATDEQAEVQRLREEIAQWQDKYLRKLAEFDNYRKRTRQENEMLRQVVAESLMAGLLPIVDDFERMMANSAADDPLRKGVELIYVKVQAFLESQNVSKFECVGSPFDAEKHDALFLQATPDFPSGTVLNVITPGYRMGDRVIRHAQVVVSAEPTAEQETGGEDSAPDSDVP